MSFDTFHTAKEFVVFNLMSPNKNVLSVLLLLCYSYWP